MNRFPAHFNGKYLRPDVSVQLPTGKLLWVTVEESTDPLPNLPDETLPEFFQRLETEIGLFDGPPDLASEHDHYLYGTPKRKKSDGE